MQILFQKILGVYWIIYYNKIDVVNIGCGFIENKSQRDRLIKYLNFLGLKNWDPKTILNWIIPIRMPKQLCTDRVLWIGDTVAMAHVYTGHGMPNMYTASKPLVNTIVQALKSNDFSKKNLETYQNHKELQHLIRFSRERSRKIVIFNFLNKFFPKWLKNYIANTLLIKNIKKQKALEKAGVKT